MKFYRILPAVVVLVLILAACNRNPKAAQGPWKGHWFVKAENENGGEGDNLYIRLDFYGSTVSSGGFENALGVMSIYKDGTRFTPVTADVITGANILSDVEAEIQYVQQSSGQLWSGTLFYHPDTRQLTFRNGKMLRDGSKETGKPVVLPYGVPIESLAFDHISDKPNYKEIGDGELIMKFPDRTYYIRCLADEIAEPPYGNLQLRCYYPETDEDILLTNEVGESPLDPRFRSTIIDCWKLPDSSGLGLIVWCGGTADQEFTLFRINEENVFKEVDYVSGPRAPRYEQGPVDDQNTCSMYRDGDVVKVYDPTTGVARHYDMNCVLNS